MSWDVSVALLTTAFLPFRQAGWALPVLTVLTDKRLIAIDVCTCVLLFDARNGWAALSWWHHSNWERIAVLSCFLRFSFYFCASFLSSPTYIFCLCVCCPAAYSCLGVLAVRQRLADWEWVSAVMRQPIRWSLHCCFRESEKNESPVMQHPRPQLLHVSFQWFPCWIKEPSFRGYIWRLRMLHASVALGEDEERQR